MALAMSGYEERPTTFTELLHRAEETLAGRSKSYVADASAFAAWIKNDGAMLQAQRQALIDFIEKMHEFGPGHPGFNEVLGAAIDAARSMK